MNFHSPGRIKANVRVSNRNNLETLRNTALAFGNWTRRGMVRAYPVLRTYGTRFLVGLSSVTLFLLELISMVAEAVASLPWKETLQRWSRYPEMLILKPTMEFMRSRRKTPPVEPNPALIPGMFKGNLWIAGIAVGALAAIGITWCLVSGSGATIQDTAIERFASVPISAPADPVARDIQPLDLLMDGPVTEARAYPLDEAPGIVVDVSSRGSALGLGEIQSSHPGVLSINARPYDGGTRFVIHTRGDRAPKWQMSTEGQTISLKLIDG